MHPILMQGCPFGTEWSKINAGKPWKKNVCSVKNLVFSVFLHRHFSLELSCCRSLGCMGGHCLVLPIERLGESALLPQQLFQQFSQCPYQGLEVPVFLHLLLLMMDIPLIDLLLRQQLKIFSSTGQNDSYFVLIINLLLISRRG